MKITLVTGKYGTITIILADEGFTKIYLKLPTYFLESYQLLWLG
jgi:hypothetical protein